MDGDVKAIGIQDLLGEATRLRVDGYRLVTLSGVCTAPDRVEILYHFDRRLGLFHLRLSVPPAAVVPSISPVHPAAFLAENEIQDLFPVSFSGLPIDYRGRMLLPPPGEGGGPALSDAPDGPPAKV